MSIRLSAMLDAVQYVRPALVKFYASLSDEQKARFNALGPDLEKIGGRAPDRDRQALQANCNSAKAGLSGLAVERIEQVVQPTRSQEAALDRLDDTLANAVDTLRQACPATVPLTPVGRLEAMEKRLAAMLTAANTVRPALDDFYAALSDEQKAKFNRLGRDAAQSGG
jgi:hypothetical protein